jgi:phosphinothricin acetyltransferase
VSSDVQIVPAAEAHVPAIAAIYDAAARTSIATFDMVGQSEGWWHDALAQVDQSAGRILLAALDPAGEVLGYAKSGEHKSRPAYAATCETSAYVADEARGLGVGGVLYDALLARLDESPLRLAVGGVAEPNEASARLHVSRGFTLVGTFRGAGVKHGREIDVTWYQRRLAAPAVVEELRALVRSGASPADAWDALRRHYPGARVGDFEAGVPIVDASSGQRLAAIDVRQPLGDGDRMLVEWCAETLAPLWRG